MIFTEYQIRELLKYTILPVPGHFYFNEQAYSSSDYFYGKLVDRLFGTTNHPGGLNLHKDGSVSLSEEGEIELCYGQLHASPIHPDYGDYLLDAILGPLKINSSKWDFSTYLKERLFPLEEEMFSVDQMKELFDLTPSTTLLENSSAFYYRSSLTPGTGLFKVKRREEDKISWVGEEQTITLNLHGGDVHIIITPTYTRKDAIKVLRQTGLEQVSMDELYELVLENVLQEYGTGR